jgi:hypothetical protein
MEVGLQLRYWGEWVCFLAARLQRLQWNWAGGQAQGLQSLLLLYGFDGE